MPLLTDYFDVEYIRPSDPLRGASYGIAVGKINGTQFVPKKGKGTDHIIFTEGILTRNNKFDTDIWFIENDGSDDFARAYFTTVY